MNVTPGTLLAPNKENWSMPGEWVALVLNVEFESPTSGWITAIVTTDESCIVRERYLHTEQLTVLQRDGVFVATPPPSSRS